MKKRDFTLVEVLFAVFIISVTIAGLYSAMFNTRNSVYAERLRGRASSLIADRLQEMVRCDYNDLKLFSRTYPDGKVETIEERQWSSSEVAEDFGEQSENTSDYTPAMDIASAVMRSAVIEFDDLCEIRVDLTWVQHLGLGEIGPITVTDTVYKYNYTR